MTVKDLKEKLNRLPDEGEVFISYPAGDYWNSILCSKIESVEYERVRWSNYHRSFRLNSETDDEEGDDGADEKDVILIN